MRGKEVQGLLQDLVGGITPAYAGKVDVVHLPVVFRGITPACAGKSTQYFPACSCIWDHPRVCGEKAAASSKAHKVIGSPPRMRGKVLWTSSRGSCTGDHPRVCGEKFALPVNAILKPGSPPRVRGKVFDCVAHFFKVGITPACTGKRCGCSRRLPERRDHPRVCVEKTFSGIWVMATQGSPPHVRGKVSAGKILLHDGGITPAYAGKSFIQHLTASLGEFEVQKGHPVPHLRQRLQVWPDHARHLRHGLILHASRSAGQGRRPCRAPCPDTAGSGTPRGPSPAKHPHTSPPAATPGGCRAWQSGATAPGSR